MLINFSDIIILNAHILLIRVISETLLRLILKLSHLVIVILQSQKVCIFGQRI